MIVIGPKRAIGREKKVDRGPAFIGRKKKKKKKKKS